MKEANMRYYAFLFYLLTVISNPAKADLVNEILQIQCYPELGVLNIIQTNINGEKASKALDEIPEEIAKKYNIYDVFSLISHHNYRGATGKTFKQDCTVNGKQYTISITPTICNSSLGGFLGGHRSIDVTVLRDKKMIIDKYTFSPCPYQKLAVEPTSFEKMVINEEEGYIQLFGRKNGYLSEDIADLEKKPLKRKKPVFIKG